jgi:hypothetical protein
LAGIRFCPASARLGETVFIRQSIRSDYCAVYSTAMYMSLVGRATGRVEALRMFGARPGAWTGARHVQIRQILEAYVPHLRTRWRHISAPTCAKVVKGFLRAASTGMPALVTAYCLHRRYGLTCGHTFLITGATDRAVLILDSLCMHPSEGNSYNARISVSVEDSDGDVLPVLDSPWDLVLTNEISILQCLN